MEELEIVIEFKLQIVKSDIINIKDSYLKNKFDDLMSSLPFQLGQHADFEGNLPITSEKVTLEELELEIYSYIKTKYKLKKTVYKIQTLLKCLKDKKSSPNGSFFDSFEKIYVRVVFMVILCASSLVVLLIILNGFNISRDFLQNGLKRMSFLGFSIVFDAYTLFVTYLIIHGILKSKFQNFKGLNAHGNTDVQSLIYFARLDKKKHFENGDTFLF